MRENVISALIIIGVLALVGGLWFVYQNPALNPRLEVESYTIIRKWEMPEELDEISGIDYIEEDKIACVQDEEGIIYIYNLNTNLVDRKINFAKAGDYEGLAIVDSTAYILESNGKLHQVSRYRDSTFATSVLQTPFTGKNNVESLTLDAKNRRLLMIAKDSDLHSKQYKGIYAFDLESKKVLPQPVYKINMNDPLLMDDKKDGDLGEFYPSDLAINPVDGNIYILEGKVPKLLIMDSEGNILRLHKLYKKSFPQPEGITFAPDGTLYISNEGKNGEASILEVELKEEK